MKSCVRSRWKIKACVHFRKSCDTLHTYIYRYRYRFGKITREYSTRYSVRNARNIIIIITINISSSRHRALNFHRYLDKQVTVSSLKYFHAICIVRETCCPLTRSRVTRRIRNVRTVLLFYELSIDRITKLDNDRVTWPMERNRCTRDRVVSGRHVSNFRDEFYTTRIPLL